MESIKLILGGGRKQKEQLNMARTMTLCGKMVIKKSDDLGHPEPSDIW
jgi:hypothetical protein